MADFKLISDFEPSGDQPKAINELINGLNIDTKHQTLLDEMKQDLLNPDYEFHREFFILDKNLDMHTAIAGNIGSGKTTLLTTTLNALKNNISLAVIEGDQETANDADRIRETGVSAVQVNTGKGCHLDAHMIGHALEKLSFEEQGLLFIENVGNLVCPAGFDLGEAHKVAILSVTEGEDKPLKYPDMFHAADVLLLNKVDLLPYLDFDVELCIENAKKVNPNIDVIRCSATTGEGMQEWYQWLESHRIELLNKELAPLKMQIADIEKVLAQKILEQKDLSKKVTKGVAH